MAARVNKDLVMVPYDGGTPKQDAGLQPVTEPPVEALPQSQPSGGAKQPAQSQGGTQSGTPGGTQDIAYTALQYLYQPYNRGQFSYAQAPEYTNRYQAQIDNLTQKILHAPGFNYNLNTDPLYQQYADQYNRNGQNAMRNTLAQVAARTGGMASSYAGTAAQNAYNEYMQGLNDRVPELYQLAYGMYNDDLNRQRNNLSMLQALEEGDYAKYADILRQYNTDRNLAYDIFSDEEAAKQRAHEQEQDYLYKEALNRQNFENELALARLQAEAGGRTGEPMAEPEKEPEKEPGNEPKTPASNYERIEQAALNMANSGQRNEEVRAFIEDAVRQKFLTPAEAEKMKMQFAVFQPQSNFALGARDYGAIPDYVADEPAAPATAPAVAPSAAPSEQNPYLAGLNKLTQIALDSVLQPAEEANKKKYGGGR